MVELLFAWNSPYSVLMSPSILFKSCPDFLLGLNCVFTKEQEHLDIYSGHVPL